MHFLKSKSCSYMYALFTNLIVCLFICYTDCYPLFLLKCPQQPRRVGHYILCFNDKLNVYSTHNGQRVWTWNIGHLRRFSYEPKVPFIEIEPGRLICVCIFFIPYVCMHVRNYAQANKTGYTLYKCGYFVYSCELRRCDIQNYCEHH